MNTPAHLAASLLVWRKEPGWRAASAVGLGAILPDAPMFGFYAYQKLVAARSEREIWSTLYFDDRWQLLFDVFNSIPLLLVVVIVSHRSRFHWGVWLGASALLHACCDLPLHHDDAHRHFLPLTDWRFASPVSYWDPRHFGQLFVWLELVFAVLACSWVLRRQHPLPMRILAGSTLALYLIAITFAVIFWLS